MKQLYLRWRQKWYELFLVRRYPIVTQLFKFAIVGLSSFLVDLTVYISLTRGAGLYYILANCFSFLVAVVWSFSWNKYWTFRRPGRLQAGQQYFKFLLVSTGGLVLTSGLLYLLVDIFFLHDVIAKFLVAIVVMLWNFSLNKIWTFKPSYDA